MTTVIFIVKAAGKKNPEKKVTVQALTA